MHQVTISDLQRNIRDIQDAALKGPVSITRNGKEKYVLLTADEYYRLKRRDREVLGIEELRAQDVRNIAAAKVPKEYEYLNHLLSH